MFYVGINGTIYLRNTEIKNFSDAIDFMVKEKLGNLFSNFTVEFGEEIIPSIQTYLADTNAPAVKAAEKCASKKIMYAPIYADFSQEIADHLKAKCGKYFLGPIIGEPSGLPVSNWNKEPRMVNDSNRHLNHNAPICFASNMQEAKDTYVKWMKEFVGKYHGQGFKNVLSVEPNAFHHYNLEAGIDIPCCELLPRRTQLILSSLRGASISFKKDTWGSWIAIGYYGGEDDGFKDLRFKIALYVSYIHGAKIFIQETDHFGITPINMGSTAFFFKTPGSEKDETSDKDNGLFNDLSVKYRRVLSDFYEYTQKHKRPEGGPEASIAFLNGNLDGWNGSIGKCVWGQAEMGKHWEYGAPEEGWNLLDYFYPESSPDLKLTERRHFSGSPYGIVDILPICNIPLNILKKYKCLIMPSWNTMTDAIYRKLGKYVKAGGVLFTGLAQFNTENDRSKKWKLFNGGKLGELCGFSVLNSEGQKEFSGSASLYNVKVTGKSVLCLALDKKYEVPYSPEQACFLKLNKNASTVISFPDKRPFLVEHSLGKGRVLTFSLYDWIGKSARSTLTGEIVRSLAEKYGTETRIKGSTWVDWAEYKWNNSFSNVYLLNANTQRTEKISVHSDKGIDIPLTLSPGGIEILHITGKFALWAPDNQIYFKPLNRKKNSTLFDFAVSCPEKMIAKKIKVQLMAKDNITVKNVKYNNMNLNSINSKGNMLKFTITTDKKTARLSIILN